MFLGVPRNGNRPLIMAKPERYTSAKAVVVSGKKALVFWTTTVSGAVVLDVEALSNGHNRPIVSGHHAALSKRRRALRAIGLSLPPIHT